MKTSVRTHKLQSLAQGFTPFATSLIGDSKGCPVDYQTPIVPCDAMISVRPESGREVSY